MYCNGLPERNVGFLPYVHEILRILESESLAIEPIQLNLKLEESVMCERCMKTREEQIEWDKTHKLNGGREMKTKESNPVQGDPQLFEEIEKQDPREVYEEPQSRSLLHHKAGVCPQCEADMYVVSTSKAFGKSNQACECEHCGYVENR